MEWPGAIMPAKELAELSLEIRSPGSQTDAISWLQLMDYQPIDIQGTQPHTHCQLDSRRRTTTGLHFIFTILHCTQTLP